MNAQVKAINVVDSLATVSVKSTGRMEVVKNF